MDDDNESEMSEGGFSSRKHSLVFNSTQDFFESQTLKDKIDILEKEVTKYKQKSNHYEKESLNLTQVNNKLVLDLEDLNHKIQTLQAVPNQDQANSSKEKLKEAIDRISILEKQLHKSDSDKSDIKGKYEALKSQFEE